MLSREVAPYIHLVCMEEQTQVNLVQGVITRKLVYSRSKLKSISVKGVITGEAFTMEEQIQI